MSIKPIKIAYHDLGESAGWSRKPNLEVILELSDSVIVDQVSQKKFTVSKRRKEELMEAFQYVAEIVTA